MIRIDRTAFSSALLTTLLAGTLAAQEAIPAPLADRIPALADQSSWAQDVDSADPDARRGCYPIGNGRVFGWFGAGPLANELHGFSGPQFQPADPRDYEPANNTFGSLVVELRSADGAPVQLSSQRIRRVRGAAFVVTEDAGDDLVLRTLNFAPAEGSSIVRVIEIENRGTTTSGALEVVVRAPKASAEFGALVARCGLGSNSAVAAIVLEGGMARDDVLVRSVDAIGTGQKWAAVVGVMTKTGEEPELPTPSLETATESAKATLAHWQSQLDRTLAFDTDHAKLRDLVQDWKVNLLLLRDARSGVFVPARYRRSASVVENNGALIAALRLGLWDEARGVLEYWWKATKLLRNIPREMPLNLDFSTTDAEYEEFTTTPEFWQSVSVPPGSAASWIILQHLWYWRTTGDTALIERHWPMLEVCLKSQRRGPDDMMQFYGDEPWLRLAKGLGPDIAEPSLFVAEGDAYGRRSWSFESSVLFILAVQATGELIDGLDAVRHPERWAEGDPDDRPSSVYARRSFDVLKAVEKRFWNEEAGYFAPAVSPIGERQHLEPMAMANLLPLWAGWTFPTGEKSRDNLRNSLARLWRQGARIGSTPTVGHAPGDLQGQLLTALSERDGKRRLDVLDSLLELAEPAGDWPSFIDPEGRAFGIANRAHPERLSPGVGGTNLDAILFAISGIRHASVPNWDDDDIRLELRLPHGASFVTMRGSKKDERELNVFFRRERSMLTEEEMKANDQLAEEKRRDPSVPHDRLRFVVEMVRGNPTKGYYDVGLNAEGTMFVRYLQPTAPATPEDPDLRKIEEMEFSRPDSQEFLPEVAWSPPTTTRRETVRADAPDLLVLTWRTLVADTMRGEGVTIFDTGLPFAAEDLLGALRSPEGQLVHPRVFIDWYMAAPPPRRKIPNAFWGSSAWREALAAYTEAGGQVLAPEFVRAVEWADADSEDLWRPTMAEEDGRIRIPPEAVRFRFRVRARSAQDAVLRVGCSEALQILRDREHILAVTGSEVTLPDTDVGLVRLAEGVQTFDVEIEWEHDLEESPELELFLRFSDANGLPIDVDV